MLGVISDDVVLVFLLLTLNIFAGMIPSTFLLPLSTTGVRYRYLLPVYGSRNSIFIWVFKLKNAETLTTIFYSAFRIIKLFNNKYKIKDVVTAVLHNFYDAWVIYSSKVSGARSVSGLFSLLMCYHCSFAFYVNDNSPFMLAKKKKKQQQQQQQGRIISPAHETRSRKKVHSCFRSFAFQKKWSCAVIAVSSSSSMFYSVTFTVFPSNKC